MSASILAAYRWLGRLQLWADGQGLVEYVLILALVSVFALVALTGLGQAIITKLYTLAGSL